MDKTEIEKNIGKAVKIFRETLEGTYLNEDREFYGIGVHSFSRFLSGKVNLKRLSNGNLKISGEVSKIAIRDECSGLPMKFEDWDIYPIVVTLFNKDIGENKDG